MNNEKTFHVMTFGCQMNVHDSEWLARALSVRGWTEVSEEDARVYVVNTCSVREKPEQKVYSLLGRLKSYMDAHPERFVVVGGCVAQQIGRDFLARYPYVRFVFGTDQIGRAPETIDRLAEEEGKRMALLDFEDGYPAQDVVIPEAGPVSHIAGQAFVNIMKGCDNFCAYCIVPYVRGRQRSRSADDVVNECRALVERGVREITLLGQNVNSFGLDKQGDGTSFAELLERVATIDGLSRLRFTTSHPKDIAPEVIAAFGRFETLCPSLHLPMQAGSDSVLRAMGRGYDMQRYMGLVEALRAVRPDIALTTDLIVGFPGETDEDFRQTLQAVERVGFESSFSFMYSDRPGTRAEKMAFKIDRQVKGERLMELQALQERLTADALAACVGREAEVLVESHSKVQASDDVVSWRGRDRHGRVVNFPWPSEGGDLTGKLVRVGIETAKKHSLWGKAVGNPW
ncbi:tRNA-2-methylthio-N6-dimethylallyladenosine synthase [Desulfobaculum xiamenense]|uniref:tRNA-2-methylthio-N(6)-dimethylallyladenosine synthase n=1 Tax=Desulfobaculum xiamenense TaxID=995050 RepID=A0A846QLN6_9BACT|nr:tRNA (N6-isopentenyl adenosine(37)-C2)-methylthiotransferase MiaB [Desulfobaculum xiamenense]NJB67372.1 tRNA-2-methylthio-N6-dimethylallyladenosine synthase [Desulfobaculum xiamenense]